MNGSKTPKADTVFQIKITVTMKALYDDNFQTLMMWLCVLIRVTAGIVSLEIKGDRLTALS